MRPLSGQPRDPDRSSGAGAGEAAPRTPDSGQTSEPEQTSDPEQTPEPELDGTEAPTLVPESGFEDQTLVQGEALTHVGPHVGQKRATPGSPGSLMAGAAPEKAGTPHAGSQPEVGLSEAPHVFAGRFEVIREIGEGGMGQVYAVRDRHIEGRMVALKLLRAQFSQNRQFRELFFQEIKAAQSFVSEHVVQVRDTGQMDDGKLFLTMDLVEGESLTDQLAREHSLGMRQALEVARQILLGLQSGHDRGFVHRDIKPSNIMLQGRVPKTDENPFGVHVKILDFGLASVAADIDEDRIAGTPMYMSPEQAQGQRLDARSDLFAVGVVLYEMLAGQRPFAGETFKEITASVIETNVAPMIGELSHLSGPIQKILNRALQKDRDKRFQSAAEFIKAIESSKAYAIPKGTSALALAGLVVFGLGAMATGALAWRLNDENIRLNDEVLNAGVLRNRAALKARAAKDTEIAGLNESIRALQAESLSGVRTSTQENVDKLALEQKISTLEERVRAEERERKRFERELETAGQRLADLQQGVLPEAIMAHGFDRIARFIDSGNGRLALGEFRGLVNRGVFDKDNVDGREFVMAIAEAAERMEQYQANVSRGQGADISLLNRANTLLDEAASWIESFELAATSWIQVDLDGQSETARIELAENTLAMLQSQLDYINSSLGSMDEDEWAELEARHAGDPAHDPSDVFHHTRRHFCEHLLIIEKRFVEYLDSHVAAGSQLNAQAIEGLDVLDVWGRYFDGKSMVDRSPSSARILLYWYAWTWYGSGELAGKLAANPLRVPPLENYAPKAYWEAQLALQQALARPDSAFPLPSGSECVYRFSPIEESGGNASWWVETPDELGSSGPGWASERRILYGDTSRRTPAIHLEITRKRDTFHLHGIPVLNLLKLGRDVGVARWTPPIDDELLDQHWSPTADDFQAFHDELVRRPADCLVVKSGTFIRWFSPRYGLVREENEGVSVRELVYARFDR